ncbi:MAG: hypothetical protein V1493_06130 [Candidatus Diapherotrites archaeon]
MGTPRKRTQRRASPVPRMPEKPEFLMRIGKTQIYVMGGKYVNQAGQSIILTTAEQEMVTAAMRKRGGAL